MNDDFLYQPMISYLGNKRKLLNHIDHYITLSNPKTALDGFAGSGVVSRLLRTKVSTLFVNDLEPYSIAIQKGYLCNAPKGDVQSYLEDLNALVDQRIKSKKKPEISLLHVYYSPKDSDNIQEGERCFYSTENGLRIDHYISLLRKEHPFRDIALANLLVKCSIHTNTSGVFKAFYKVDGVGHWGGYKEHDLQRILRPIRLECPIFDNHKTDVYYSTRTVTGIWDEIKEPLDFVYYDPPYNQHPYGSNYFMLNVIHDAVMKKDYLNHFTVDPNSVSGIPKDWTRSEFNYRKTALSACSDMIDCTESYNILVSYNDNGMVSKEEMKELLNSRGYDVQVEEIRYKNLNSRPSKKMKDSVNEYLFYGIMKDI